MESMKVERNTQHIPVYTHSRPGRLQYVDPYFVCPDKFQIKLATRTLAFKIRNYQAKV